MIQSYDEKQQALIEPPQHKIDGKHKDGNSRHNNSKMEIYGTMDVYWSD